MRDNPRFRDVLKGKNRRKPPFVPFVSGLAGRTANFTVQEMSCDPSCEACALEGCCGLLCLDTIVVNYDDTIEAEALGAEVSWTGDYDAPMLQSQEKTAEIDPAEFLLRGRIPTVIETVKRLSISSAGDKAVACALLGPCSLVRLLQSTFKNCSNQNAEAIIEQYGNFLTKLVRAICDQKIDALFFREDMLDGHYMQELCAHQDAYKSLYKTLFNIVNAYNAFPLIVTRHLAIESIKDVHALLSPSGIVLLGDVFDRQRLTALLETAKGLRLSFGLPLPISSNDQEELSSSVDQLESFIQEHKPNNIFYCSDGEIPHDIDLGILLELMERINEGGE
jgi:hypothetical protein